MKLTTEQRAEIKNELVESTKTRPVRFLRGGRALNITNGELCTRGSKIMYHPVYWHFSRETAKKVATWLRATTVWSK